MGRWAPAPDENCYGVAIFEFDGHKYAPECLSLELGERVFIYEECDGWYRGCSTSKQNIKGIFPKSYVKIKPSVREVSGNQITIIPIEDAITEEAKNVLREWHDLWKDLFTASYNDTVSYNYKANIDLFQAIKSIMSDIIRCLSSSYLGVLGQNQLEEKKVTITQSIDNGNMLLNLDLVPRDEHGNKVNPVTCSDRTPDQKGVLELYSIHKRVNTHHTHKGSDAARPNEPVHLFLGICQCVLLNQTPLEVYATLYNFDVDKMISERFLAPLTKNGLPEDRERLNDISTVFTDISREDLAGLYIIIRYYRRGPLQLDNNSKDNNSTQEFLRPLGLSYISIKTYIDTMEANVGVRSDNNINRLDIYTLRRDNRSESNFSDLHKKVIMGERAQFQQLDRTQGLYISNLKVFTGSLESVQQKNPHIFKKSSISPDNMITRKLGFAAVINPSDQRNDLYITLTEAKFKRGDKKAERNVLVNVSVRDSSGKEIKGCISKGTGEPSVDHYKSSVIYHCNTPAWDETFRINLPDDSYSFSNCHLLFTFRHENNKSKNKDKPGFSFLKLANVDGTLINNDNHKLVVYKETGKHPTEFRRSPSEYLHLESYFNLLQISRDTKMAPSNILQTSSEYLEISTVFCSSKFTQNSDLKSLLQWEEHEGRLGQILKSVQMIQGEELVKFLQYIFEALFMILDKKDNEYGEIVFDCIVFIICTLADHKFEHFRPVLDSYISTYFFHTQVYIKLLDRLKSKVEQYQTSKNIGDVMKALEYLFKFIVQSSHLHSQASTIDRSFNKFTKSLLEFFDKLNIMISSHHNRVATAKTLKYFPHTIPELNKILPLHTTCQIISNFIDAVPNMDEKEIIRYKLSCMDELVKGEILDDPVGCDLLIPLLMKHLKIHLKDEETARDWDNVRKEKVQAVEILTHILVTVSNKHSNTGIVKKIVEPLLELLFRLVCQVDKVNDMDLARDYVSCLIALLHLMNGENYTSYMEPMNEHHLIDFLNEVFLVFKDLMKNNVYPPMWIVMSMLQSYVVLNAIIYFSKALTKIPPQCTGPQDYMGKKKQLWENFFYLCVGFITQDTLQLEEFREAKRKKIAAQYGDMRSEMCQEMVMMFNKLGDNKKIFLPEIVGPFLEVTLVPLESLRKEIIPIFFDMIECYHRDRGNFEIVEREVIDKLDVLISSGKGDTKYSLLMYETLLKKFNSPDINKSLHQNGVRFVNSVKGILDHLLNFREVREGDHHSEARMLCIVDLLNFYGELNRQEMYLRYIWKLYTSHLAQKNYVEAAFTLEKYHSKLKYEDDVYVDKFEELPRERSRERKARLSNMVIKHFEEGKSYEYTFSFYKSLCDYYEETFNYRELAAVLQRQAAGYIQILEANRFYNDYYYVGFFGQGFPAFLRNKRFIYRGRELDRMSLVTLRLQEQFPQATLLNYTSEPTTDTTESPEQFLQIYTVTGVVEERFEGRDVPSLISQFYDTNDICAFYYDRRFNKSGGKLKDDDFANTWLEKTKFFTIEPLPGKLRLAEITRKDVVELSPLKCALDTMEKKNRELRIMIDGYKAQRETNANPLTMALKGTVDAVVMGGIKNYEKAFFIPEYTRNNPADNDSILFLKKIIIDQVEILQDGVDVHGKVCAEAVKPLHNHIAEQLEKMRQDTNCYRRELGMSSGTPVRSLRASTASLHRNSTLSRNMRSRSSMISVISNEESVSLGGVTGGATPPPLPSRAREVLPDPAALVRERRTAAAPDQPALPPKKRTSVVHSPSMGSSSPLTRDSSRSINSNGSFDMSYSNNSINNDNNEVQNPGPTLPPRPKGSPDGNNGILTDDNDIPPPLPQRTNSTAARPPKVPRDKTVPLPTL